MKAVQILVWAVETLSKPSFINEVRQGKLQPQDGVEEH